MILIEEFNKFYMTLSCISFEDQRKINDWITEKMKAGGIESYFTSPLALREQYGTESQPKSEYPISYYIKGNICEPLIDYIEWLEKKLCNLKGS